MSVKRIRRLGAILAAVGIWMAASINANATVTLADTATGDGSGVGYIQPTVIPPSGMSVDYLNNMIIKYNGGTPTPIHSEGYFVYSGTGTPGSPLPSAISLNSEITPSAADGYGSPTATIHLGTGGYNYLVAQWDGKLAADAVYWIGGLSGDITLINDLPGFDDKGQPLSKYGLSGYWLAPVPEPTTMIAGALLLLPFGFSTVRVLRRKSA